MGTALATADTVLVSAWVELTVPVVTPLASVGVVGCVSVFAVPLAVSVTVFPLIALPYWSRTVTVIVLVLLPLEAVIVPGVAFTVVCWALTGPGTVIAVKVSGDATPVACTSWMLSVGVMTVPSWLLPASIVICVAPPTVPFTVNVTVVAPPLSVAVAVVVCAPGVKPNVRVVVACPAALVTELVGLTEPPPVAAAQVTVTPPTGFPLPSVIKTSCGVASVVPTSPLRLSPENFAIVVAAPTVAVAVKVTGLPDSWGDVVAVSVWVPAVAPSVQVVAAAMPLPSVSTGVTGVTLPLPGAAANVTVTPPTGLPLMSRTTTDGAMVTAVPTGAV